MTDTNDQPPIVPPLPGTNDLSRFFKSFQMKNCPVCDHNNFSVVTAPEGMAGFFLYYRAKRNEQRAPVVQSFVNPSVFAVLNTMCSKCGYLHSFSLKHIEQWLEKNPEGKA
ncbi:hypothetical protein ACT2FY_13080 [Paraburkholderia fungorum]|uniref:hypothetical protein n=1 Tax=Paraburkholderia fungorum TaxID=134537 RepID=UPI00402B7D6A